MPRLYLRLKQAEEWAYGPTHMGCITQSTSQTCTVKVQSTERSLMASGEYRGGQTITGVLNDSEHVVAIRFPVAETEFIEGLKNGQIVTAEAVIYRWSGALKQANLEATGARIA